MWNRLLALIAIAPAALALPACLESHPSIDLSVPDGARVDAGPGDPLLDAVAPSLDAGPADATPTSSSDAGATDAAPAALPGADDPRPPCALDGLIAEGRYDDTAPAAEGGALRIHLSDYPTTSARGACDSFGGDALPQGTWMQEVRHGRAAIVQSRQRGLRICVAVATASHDILYLGAIAADCRSMSGTYEGVLPSHHPEHPGAPHRGTWTVALVP